MFGSAPVAALRAGLVDRLAVGLLSASEGLFDGLDRGLWVADLDTARCAHAVIAAGACLARLGNVYCRSWSVGCSV